MEYKKTKQNNNKNSLFGLSCQNLKKKCGNWREDERKVRRNFWKG